MNLNKQLDDAETEFLARWEGWLNKMGKLPVDSPAKEILSWHPPNSGELADLLAGHLAEMFAAGRAHGDRLVAELRRKYAGRRLADLPVFDFDYKTDPKLLPLQAIRAMEERALVLAGIVEAELVAEVKKAIIRRLTGVPRKEVEAEIQHIINANRNRASLITTTETTYAYNRGRLVSFREHGVDYVQFSAILDKRTSVQCRTRHGLVMRLDDPRLPRNTPPLHGHCRSVLKPIFSKYQPELITPERLDWRKAAPLPKGWRAGGEASLALPPEGGIMEAGKNLGAAAGVIAWIRSAPTLEERERRIYQYLINEGYDLPGLPRGVDFSERGRAMVMPWGLAAVQYTFTLRDGRQIYYFKDREIDHILIHRIENGQEGSIKYLSEIPAIVRNGKEKGYGLKSIFASKRKYRWERIAGEPEETNLIVVVRKEKNIFYVDTFYPQD
ncbi:MAG: minor capsid protein [Bacillota bacterium]